MSLHPARARHNLLISCLRKHCCVVHSERLQRNARLTFSLGRNLMTIFKLTISNLYPSLISELFERLTSLSPSELRFFPTWLYHCFCVCYKKLFPSSVSLQSLFSFSLWFSKKWPAAAELAAKKKSAALEEGSEWCKANTHTHNWCTDDRHLRCCRQRETERQLHLVHQLKQSTCQVRRLLLPTCCRTQI